MGAGVQGLGLPGPPAALAPKPTCAWLVAPSTGRRPGPRASTLGMETSLEGDALGVCPELGHSYPRASGHRLAHPSLVCALQAISGAQHELPRLQAPRLLLPFSLLS